ncbi:hypothetical protein AWW66_23220 [Micromonospora rosaria]|uniref:DUF202 domain-containing protein n=1 Tax=Micromonospora rosaria TaxID=47874 RepID=A0A136PMK4_9ACTN|nr:DUF202 domain-containing protein [Micromonospora rosaria]KXK59624.1 hypothetical protein AWW66_23220 [Micromonospora rosaria]
MSTTGSGLRDRRRFPRRVYGHGTEPDPRFSLANERTFLAWIRTSLALVAAGVALTAIQVPVSAPFRFAAALLLALLGVAAACQGWIGWMRTERALREHRALAGPSLGVLLAAGVVTTTVLVAAGVVW